MCASLRELSMQLNFLMINSHFRIFWWEKKSPATAAAAQERSTAGTWTVGKCVLVPNRLAFPEELCRFLEIIYIRMTVTYIGNWTSAQGWAKCHEKLCMSSHTFHCIIIDCYIHVGNARLFNKTHNEEPFSVLLHH